MNTTITVKPRSYCFIAFHAIGSPKGRHESDRLNAVSHPHEPSRVALRRAVVKEIKELFCVQLLKSASIYIAPLSSMKKLYGIADWLKTSPENEAHIFEGDYEVPAASLFGSIIEEAQAVLMKTSKQRIKSKGRSQLLYLTTLLEHYEPLLDAPQREELASLIARYKEINDLEEQ